MRTATTCSLLRRRRCSIFWRLARILRVWYSTESGSARTGFSNSTGPMPEMKPQPSTQTSGLDMFEETANALRHFQLALLRAEVVHLHVSHRRAAAEVRERLGIGQRA